ncbi:MAG: hypothetical protein ACI4CY_02275 [Candidatus Gastranaerophilaceae bacterium]
MTLNENMELPVARDVEGFAAIIASGLDTQFHRKRVYKSLLCMDALADYLSGQGFDVRIAKNLYKIMPLNKEFEFTDLYCNSWFLDVRGVVDGRFMLVPKIHFQYGILPDIYVAANRSVMSGNIKILGYIEPSKLLKVRQDEHYYIVDKSELKPASELEAFLKRPKTVVVTDTDHEIYESLFIEYLDGELGAEEKTKLVRHLTDCCLCRETFSEYYDYERIVRHMSENEDILKDYTLNAVGAVPVDEEKFNAAPEVVVPIRADEVDEPEEEDDPLKLLYSGKDGNSYFKMFDDDFSYPDTSGITESAILTEKFAQDLPEGMTEKAFEEHENEIVPPENELVIPDEIPLPKADYSHLTDGSPEIKITEDKDIVLEEKPDKSAGFGFSENYDDEPEIEFTENSENLPDNDENSSETVDFGGFSFGTEEEPEIEFVEEKEEQKVSEEHQTEENDGFERIYFDESSDEGSESENSEKTLAGDVSTDNSRENSETLGDNTVLSDDSDEKDSKELSKEDFSFGSYVENDDTDEILPENSDTANVTESVEDTGISENVEDDVNNPENADLREVSPDVDSVDVELHEGFSFGFAELETAENSPSEAETDLSCEPVSEESLSEQATEKQDDEFPAPEENLPETPENETVEVQNRQYPSGEFETGTTEIHSDSVDTGFSFAEVLEQTETETLAEPENIEPEPNSNVVEENEVGDNPSEPELIDIVDVALVKINSSDDKNDSPEESEKKNELVETAKNALTTVSSGAVTAVTVATVATGAAAVAASEGAAFAAGVSAGVAGVAENLVSKTGEKLAKAFDNAVNSTVSDNSDVKFFSDDMSDYEEKTPDAREISAISEPFESESDDDIEFSESSDEQVENPEFSETFAVVKESRGDDEPTDKTSDLSGETFEKPSEFDTVEPENDFPENENVGFSFGDENLTENPENGGFSFVDQSLSDNAEALSNQELELPEKPVSEDISEDDLKKSYEDSGEMPAADAKTGEALETLSFGDVSDNVREDDFSHDDAIVENLYKNDDVEGENNGKDDFEPQQAVEPYEQASSDVDEPFGFSDEHEEAQSAVNSLETADERRESEKDVVADKIFDENVKNDENLSSEEENSYEKTDFGEVSSQDFEKDEQFIRFNSEQLPDKSGTLEDAPTYQDDGDDKSTPVRDESGFSFDDAESELEHDAPKTPVIVDDEAVDEVSDNVGEPEKALESASFDDISDKVSENDLQKSDDEFDETPVIFDKGPVDGEQPKESSDEEVSKIDDSELESLDFVEDLPAVPTDDEFEKQYEKNDEKSSPFDEEPAQIPETAVNLDDAPDEKSAEMFDETSVPNEENGQNPSHDDDFDNDELVFIDDDDEEENSVPEQSTNSLKAAETFDDEEIPDFTFITNDDDDFAERDDEQSEALSPELLNELETVNNLTPDDGLGDFIRPVSFSGCEIPSDEEDEKPDLTDVDGEMTSNADELSGFDGTPAQPEETEKSLGETGSEDNPRGLLDEYEIPEEREKDPDMVDFSELDNLDDFENEIAKIPENTSSVPASTGSVLDAVLAQNLKDKAAENESRSDELPDLFESGAIVDPLEFFDESENLEKKEPFDDVVQGVAPDELKFEELPVTRAIPENPESSEPENPSAESDKTESEKADHGDFAPASDIEDLQAEVPSSEVEKSSDTSDLEDFAPQSEPTLKPENADVEQPVSTDVSDNAENALLDSVLNLEVPASDEEISPVNGTETTDVAEISDDDFSDLDDDDDFSPDVINNAIKKLFITVLVVVVASFAAFAVYKFKVLGFLFGDTTVERQIPEASNELNLPDYGNDNGLPAVMTTVSVKKISWAVNPSIAQNLVFKKYLQNTGNLIHEDLSSALQGYMTKTPVEPLKIMIELKLGNKVKKISLSQSSGDKVLDKKVLQSVNEILKTVRVPEPSEMTAQADSSVPDDMNVKMILNVGF